jgi:branched-chain amino acid transport system ATP-binding protein
MLAIGRALLAEPKLLLLDEPTEGLAPVVIDELVKVLAYIKEQGTALLLVEQRVHFVQALAQRYVALRQGRVVSTGSVENLEDRAVQELIAM